MPRLAKRTASGPGLDGTPAPRGPARVSPLAITQLLLALAATVVRRRPREAALRAWLCRQFARGGSRNLAFRLPGRTFLLVADPALSAHILKPSPHPRGYVEGSLKHSSMAFLAPRALTISHGEAWQRRRAFNERSLCTGRPHDLRRPMLEAVTAAFSQRVETPDEVRNRMRRLMLRVVFGAGAPATLGEDIDALMEVVRRPLRRRLLGWRYRRRREHFYADIRGAWDRAPTTSLLGFAGTPHHLQPDEALEQVPHWMFPFTGSASDLLIRTLAIAGARPGVVERIEAEVRAAGPLDEPATMDQLDYLERCILEAGRLFPPVTVTFHTPPHGDLFEGREIGAGTEVVHWFPIMHRDDAHTGAHHFDPDRTVPSNLFLSGARACPGRDLILLVLKSALANLIAHHGVRVEAPSLTANPVPIAFPDHEVRFLSRYRTDAANETRSKP